MGRCQIWPTDDDLSTFPINEKNVYEFFFRSNGRNGFQHVMNLFIDFGRGSIIKIRGLSFQPGHVFFRSNSFFRSNGKKVVHMFFPQRGQPVCT